MEYLNERSQSRLKAACTYFLKNLMWDKANSRLSTVLIWILSNLQLWAILVYICLHISPSSQQDHLSYFIIRLGEILSYLVILDDSISLTIRKATLIVIETYLGFSLLIFSCTLIMYIKRHINHQVRRLTRKILNLHHAVFFWMINLHLMSSIKNEKESGESSRTLLLYIGLILYNYLIAGIGAYFRFDPFQTFNMNTCWTSKAQLINFLLKAFVAPLLVFIDHHESKFWILEITILVLTLLKFLLVLYNFPYLTYTSMKLNFITSFVFFGISALGFIEAIFQGSQDFSNTNSSYLHLVLQPVMVLFAIIWFDRIIMYYGLMSSDTVRTESQGFKKILATNFLLEKARLTLDSGATLRFKQQDLLYLSVIKEHADVCTKRDCLCKYMTDVDRNMEISFLDIRNAYGKLRYQIMQKLISGLVNKLGKCFWMRIYYAHYEYLNQENVKNSLIILYNIQRKNLGFLERLIASRLKEGIQDKITSICKNKIAGTLDIQNCVQYQLKLKTLKELIISNTEDYLNLWESYSKPDFNLRKFFSMSEKIEIQANRIDRLWKNIINSHQEAPLAAFPFYSSYLASVRNSIYSSEKLMKIYRRKMDLVHKQEGEEETKVTQNNLGDENNIFFWVSMDKRSLGIIRNVSDNVSGHLGWLPKELIGKNVNVMIPPFLQNKHHSFLLNHIEGKSTSSFSLNHVAFVRDKEGFIKQCQAYVTVSPFLTNEIIYLAVVRIISSERDYILLHEGFVDSYTEGVAEKFHISEGIHFSEICPNYIAKSRFSTTSGKSGNKKILDNVSTQDNSLRDSLRLHLAKEEEKLLTNTPPRIEKCIFLLPKLAVHAHYAIQGNNSTLYFKKSIQKDPTKDFYASLKHVCYNMGTTINYVEVTSDNQESDYDQCSIPIERTKEDILTGLGEQHISNRESNKLPKSKYFHLIGSNLISKIIATSPIPIRKQKVERGNDFQSSLASSTKSNFYKKFEEAVFNVPKPRSINTLRFFTLLYFVLCVILLFIYLKAASSNFAAIGQNLQLGKFALTQTVAVLEANAIMRRGQSALEGFMAMDRYKPHSLVLMFSISSPVLQTLINANMEFFTRMSNLDKANRDKLFTQTKITLIGRNGEEPRIVNIFTYLLNLEASYQRLLHKDPLTLPDNDPDMKLILDTSINEFLVASDYGPVLLEDCKDKINANGDYILSALILVLITGISLFLFFTKIEYAFVQNRNLLIDILLRLDEKQVREELKSASQFLEQAKKGIQSVAKSRKRDTIITMTAKESRSYSRKNADKRGLNRDVIKGMLIFFSFILIFSSGFLVLFLYQGLSVNISKLIGQIEDNFNIYDLYLKLRTTYTSLIEYITKDGTTRVRGKPIAVAWDEGFEAGSQLQRQLITVLERKEFQHPNLEQLLTGNICQLVDGREGTEEEKAFCLTSNGGTNLKGLIGMNSLMQLNLRKLKDDFDISDKSVDAKREILARKEFFDLEDMDYRWYPYVIEKLQEYLSYQVEGILKLFQDQSRTIVAVYLAIYVVCGLLLWSLLIRQITEERKNCRKLLRQIPFRVINNNKMLKSYIVNNCDKVLDSIKNFV